MPLPYAFNRLEFAGSLGDLGTLLPLAIGMIMVNGLDPSGLFLSVGLFYIFTGIYFGITTPVQPMKVIGAYAIATAMTPHQIMASGILMGACLLFIGATGAELFLKNSFVLAHHEFRNTHRVSLRNHAKESAA